MRVAKGEITDRDWRRLQAEHPDLLQNVYEGGRSIEWNEVDRAEHPQFGQGQARHALVSAEEDFARACADILPLLPEEEAVLVFENPLVVGRQREMEQAVEEAQLARQESNVRHIQDAQAHRAQLENLQERLARGERAEDEERERERERDTYHERERENTLKTRRRRCCCTVLVLALLGFAGAAYLKHLTGITPVGEHGLTAAADQTCANVTLPHAMRTCSGTKGDLCLVSQLGCEIGFYAFGPGLSRTISFKRFMFLFLFLFLEGEKMIRVANSSTQDRSAAM